MIDQPPMQVRCADVTQLLRLFESAQTRIAFEQLKLHSGERSTESERNNKNKIRVPQHTRAVRLTCDDGSSASLLFADWRELTRSLSK